MQEFKQSFDFAVFACKHDQAKTLTRSEQFGRDVVKFYNPSTKESEIQVYFYSDSQLFWPSQFHEKPSGKEISGAPSSMNYSAKTSE